MNMKPATGTTPGKLVLLPQAPKSPQLPPPPLAAAVLAPPPVHTMLLLHGGIKSRSYKNINSRHFKFDLMISLKTCALQGQIAHLTHELCMLCDKEVSF